MRKRVRRRRRTRVELKVIRERLRRLAGRREAEDNDLYEEDGDLGLTETEEHSCDEEDYIRWIKKGKNLKVML